MMTAGVAATKTVLIADDAAFVRERFQTALQEAGHRAVTAKSAAELLGRVRADLEELDLLVLDLRLPFASGVDLVRAIRKLDGGRLPILVFSGTITSAEEVRELAALGVAGYINEYSAVQHILPSLAPHLFPDNFNRRSSPRVVLSIPVAYRFGDTITAVLTLNLGKGGISIRTMSPLQVGSATRIRFRLPGRQARGRSRRQGDLERPPHRHGPAVRAGRSARPGSDRRVRGRPLLHRPRLGTASPRRRLRRRCAPGAFTLDRKTLESLHPLFLPIQFCHGSGADRRRLAAGGRPRAGRRQRLLRRGRIRDRHGAEDADRPADRRGGPAGDRRAGGDHRAGPLHRRDAGRHHDDQPRPRLDRRADRGAHDRTARSATCRPSGRGPAPTRLPSGSRSPSSRRCTSCAANWRRRPSRSSTPRRPRCSSRPRRACSCWRCGRSSRC